jgi:hypothetical protein
MQWFSDLLTKNSESIFCHKALFFNDFIAFRFALFGSGIVRFDRSLALDGSIFSPVAPLARAIRGPRSHLN